MTIKKFAIIGERCTGVEYLKEMILRNFDIEYVEICNPHYPTRFTPQENFLILATVRNIKDWLGALWANKQNMTFHARQNIIKAFLGEQIAVYDDFASNDYSAEIIENRHIYEKDPRFPQHDIGRRYHNIFELRDTKHKFMLENKLFIVKYEDMQDNLDGIIATLMYKFELPMATLFKTVESEQNDELPPAEIPADFVELIKKNTNHELEISIGYE
jgi:hypothetical protein